MADKGKSLSTEMAVRNESPSDEEAEALARRVMARAASLTGVKINRGAFLRAELRKRFPRIDVKLAVKTTPLEAGVSPSEIDSLALDVIDYETKKCAAISFLAGLPGGVAMVGTIPADLAQYFGHVMRVEQKLAYLYGWQSFLNEDDEVDDETVTRLVVLMGVMLEVGGVANSVTKFAATAAQQSVAKQIERQALTKTFFYNPMKKVLRYLGVSMTKQTFAKGASKIVPVIGGVISGGITYASFKPGAERLRRYLRSLPLSGIDEELYPDIAVIRAELAARERSEAIEKAGEAGVAALKAAGVTISSGATAAGAAVSEVAGNAGAAVAETAQNVGRAAGDAFGSLLGSLKRDSEKRSASADQYTEGQPDPSRDLK
ncbi:hypothetical protein B5F79_08885 [Olsenella sp. An285]|uniref:hypothetical protein n=1 Tax=Olsenella sp. An285 TaxID=1965621 RepID=UPI000B3ABF3A|nr:hypothetical protein [Olsenella sp. An285]OUO45852.1 hypothetical protein B5F79_08885 [Olsenella sp. An285]